LIVFGHNETPTPGGIFAAVSLRNLSRNRQAVENPTRTFGGVGRGRGVLFSHSQKRVDLRLF
jgi:hypothetical protein